MTGNQFLAELIRTKGEDDSVVDRRVTELRFAMRLRRSIGWRLRRLWFWIKPRLGKLIARIKKHKEKKNADSADHDHN